MDLIRKKQDLQQVALDLLKEYGISEKELQAFGPAYRAEDRAEFPSNYIAIATRRHLILVQLHGWYKPALYSGEAYLLDNLRLMGIKKSFLGYSLAFDLQRIDRKRLASHLLPFNIEKHQVMHLSASWRPSWNNYEGLALYLIERVRKK